MIARVADGLPLAASIQEDEQVTNTINTRLICGGKGHHQRTIRSLCLVYSLIF